MQIERLYFSCLPSTNTWAKEHLSDLEKDKLTVISAAQQTNGYGRFQRTWSSPPDQNLYLTYAFFLSQKRPDLGNISQVLALSVLRVLNTLSFFPKIKWPNDLLLNHKKLGGILCETSNIDGYLAIMLGIGLNINMTKEELHKLNRPATSLFVETGKLMNKDLILDALNETFRTNLKLFLSDGFTSFHPIFTRSLIYQKGDTVRFNPDQMACQGKFEKINNDGSLQLLMPDGTLKNFYSGELI
ncbi:MAG: biotin--[acetyl-CoA-carboxylase] ligase [Parachlamydiaceae bacterium]